MKYTITPLNVAYLGSVKGFKPQAKNVQATQHIHAAILTIESIFDEFKASGKLDVLTKPVHHKKRVKVGKGTMIIVPSRVKDLLGVDPQAKEHVHCSQEQLDVLREMHRVILEMIKS